MTGDTSASTPDRSWLRPALLGWLAAMVVLWVIFGGGVAALRFSDPDDQLRLIQVRDLLAGQGWWDLTQYRINPPDGVPMHWSRLVDAPLAAVIVLLAPVLGQHGAEVAAIALIPALTLLCTVLLVARLAHRLGAERSLGWVLACLIGALLVMVQLRPGRIDHHGWQIVLFLAAVSGLLARREALGGAVIGAALAAWCSISMEALPMIAALFGIMALFWLAEPTRGARFVTGMQALAAGSFVFAAISRNPLDLATHCDSVSPVHLAIFAWGVLAATLTARLARTRLTLAMGLGVTGAGALAILLLWAPQCAIGGGFNELGPRLAALWHAEVIEGMPVWHNRLPVALQYTVPVFAGLLLAALHTLRLTGEARARWIKFTLALAAASLSGLAISRTGAYGAALATIPLGMTLAGLWQRLRTGQGSRIAAALALAAMLTFVIAPMAPAMLVAQRLGLASAKPQLPALASCGMDAAMPAIRRLPRGVIFAQVTIGPELLMGSPHSVVATGHHRAPKAMLDVFDGLMAEPDQARAIIAAHGADYVMLCPEFPDIDRMVARAPRSIAAELRAGRTPDWLEPIALPPASKLKAWRIRR